MSGNAPTAGGGLKFCERPPIDQSGTYVMQPLSRPQQSFLSGLGVAGAVLAAVVVTFALASGIVAYSLTSPDPIVTPTAQLVLDPSRPGKAADAPLVLDAAPAAQARERSSAVAAAAAGTARRGVASNSLTTGGGGRGAGTTQDPVDADGAPLTGSVADTTERAREPVGDAIGTTGETVGATTSSLSRRLRETTGQVGARTERVVADTGDVLESVVGNTGSAVGRLLGDPQTP